MKRAHIVLASCAALLILPMAAAAEDKEAIDNIVVTGQKSTVTLRKELIKAEGDFYDLYNQLNDDNEYDVRCSYVAITGARKKEHVCRPVFFSKARHRENKMRPIDPNTDPGLTNKMVTLQEKMATLVAANPELQDKMTRYNTARAELTARREQRSNN